VRRVPSNRKTTTTISLEDSKVDSKIPPNPTLQGVTSSQWLSTGLSRVATQQGICDGEAPHGGVGEQGITTKVISPVTSQSVCVLL
jgi:hypothetical protein